MASPQLLQVIGITSLTSRTLRVLRRLKALQKGFPIANIPPTRLILATIVTRRTMMRRILDTRRRSIPKLARKTMVQSMGVTGIMQPRARTLLSAIRTLAHRTTTIPLLARRIKLMLPMPQRSTTVARQHRRLVQHNLSLRARSIVTVVQLTFTPRRALTRSNVRRVAQDSMQGMRTRLQGATLLVMMRKTRTSGARRSSRRKSTGRTREDWRRTRSSLTVS